MKKVKLEGLDMEVDVDKVENPVLKKVLDERVCGSEFQFFSRKSHRDFSAREQRSSHDDYDDHVDHSEYSRHEDRWKHSAMNQYGEHIDHNY